MKTKRRLMAWLLSAALLAGSLPGAAFAAAEGPPCENHQAHTNQCGYVEGTPCNHTEHTADCYTGDLVCGYDEEEEQTATGSDAAHEHTQDCYALDCPHERREHKVNGGEAEREGGLGHDDTCGYAEARPCKHSCDLCAVADSGSIPGTSGQNVQKSTPSVAALDVTGSGYSFTDGKLTISTDAGTTAWRSGTGIDTTAVTSLVVESGVTSIGDYAFWHCTNLALSELPSSLTSIGDYAFLGCTNLALSELPSSLTYIGDYAFSQCTNLDLSELPSGVTSIENSVFSGCTNLDLRELPSGVTYIGISAFLDCTGLTQLDMTNCSSLASIGNSAFLGCTNLALIELPGSLTSIGESAFSGCTNLALRELPSGVTSIGDYAFYGCTNLALSELPSGVTPIGNGVFSHCTNLALRELPSGVTSIGDYAFSGCAGLTQLDMTNCSSLTSIEGAAFYNCTNLALVELPSGVTSIENYAFYGCAGLAALTLHSTSAPTLGEDAFSHTPDLVIFVPAGATGYDGANWPTDKIVSGAALSDLTATGGSLSPAFHPGTENYTLSVPHHEAEVTLTLTAHGGGTIIANGTDAASSTVMAAFSLNYGETTTISIVVKNSGADTRTYTITAQRAAEKTADLASIPGVAAPARGAAPVTTITETAQYTGAVVWSPDPGSAFSADTVYTATITLTPKPGYAFNGMTKDFFTVAGATATNDADSGSVKAVFPMTGSAPSGGGKSGGSGGGSSYSSRPLTDTPTGIVVKGSQIHGSAALTVQAGGFHNAGDAGCDLLRTAQETGRVLGAWDVSLSRVFLGSVTVSLPVEGRDGQTLTVAHCIGGKLTLTNVTVKQGMAEVTADSLSPFAVLNDTYTQEELAAPVADNPFTDVKETDWFYKAVLYACQRGLMTGTAATAFDPQGAVTRAQPPVVLYRLEGSPVITGQNPFADVAPGLWFADGITWAAGAGLVDGCNATTYGPADPVTREQLATILYRYAKYKGWDVTQRDGLTAYADTGDVSAWAREAVEWAVGAGIINGTTDNRLAPKAGATRAELAQMLMRLLEKYGEPAAPVAQAPGTSKARRVRVQAGDTLSGLAGKYNLTVAAIMQANPIIQNPNFILPGWELDIP